MYIQSNSAIVFLKKSFKNPLTELIHCIFDFPNESSGSTTQSHADEDHKKRRNDIKNRLQSPFCVKISKTGRSYVNFWWHYKFARHHSPVNRRSDKLNELLIRHPPPFLSLCANRSSRSPLRDDRRKRHGRARHPEADNNRFERNSLPH